MGSDMVLMDWNKVSANDEFKNISHQRFSKNFFPIAIETFNNSLV